MWRQGASQSCSPHRSPAQDAGLVAATLAHACDALPLPLALATRYRTYDSFRLFVYYVVRFRTVDTGQQSPRGGPRDETRHAPRAAPRTGAHGRRRGADEFDGRDT